MISCNSFRDQFEIFTLTKILKVPKPFSVVPKRCTKDEFGQVKSDLNPTQFVTRVNSLNPNPTR